MKHQLFVHPAAAGNNARGQRRTKGPAPISGTCIRISVFSSTPSHLSSNRFITSPFYHLRSSHALCPSRVSLEATSRHAGLFFFS